MQDGSGASGVVAARRPASGDEAVAVRLRDILVEYEAGKPVLDLPAFEVGRGEQVAVIGPSGGGKTTLLRMINGYVEPRRGEISIFGRTIDGRGGRRRELRMRIGFVFQGFNLVERASVFENVLWGRLGRMNSVSSSLGRFTDADRRAAMRAIEEVGLVAQAAQRADTLSGGQQQRVGVARVLAQEAEIILADEPVSNLDPALADDMLELLREVSDRHEATLLMSLHLPGLAVRHAARVVGLRAGRLVWDGRAAELDEAAKRAIYGRLFPNGAGADVPAQASR